MPGYSKEVALPELLDGKYSRYVITEAIEPIVKTAEEETDKQLNNYLRFINMNAREFKDLLLRFVKSLRKRDYIPNYKELVNWVNWGHKPETRLYGGLVYMTPKMWSEKELLDFLPQVPKLRRELSTKQQYIFDALIAKEKLAVGII